MNASDPEMEHALEQLAHRCPTPSLPPDLAALPWTVQNQSEAPRRFGLLPFLNGAPLTFARAGLAAARLAVVVALSGALLLVLTRGRSSGAGVDLIQPAPSPAPTQNAAPSGAEVVLLPTRGVVDDVMADYIAGGIAHAEADGAAAVVIQLDTPGGSGEAMRRIMGSLHARVPTIVWVGPGGARAASAGSFITMAGNLAYMAPGTNIGAASPVSPGGGDIASQYGQTEADKVMEDAMALMRSAAQERHPQAVIWAVAMVQTARSYSAEEALAAQGINGLAANLDQVLAAADGQTVSVDGESVVIHTSGATILTINEDPIQTILHVLDDPNIAFILLVIGVLCILVEFFHPTLLVGLTGAAALILAFYGSGSLPLNIVGVLLVILGIVMLALEPAIPSHGTLTIGGLAAFIIGAVAFYGSPGPFLPGVSVAWPIILTMTVLAAAYGLFFVSFALRMRHMVVPEGSGMIGTEQVVGTEGMVQAPLDPVGTVYAARQSWTAREAGGASLPRGTEVRVVAQEGLTLIVEKVESGSAANRDTSQL
jgi:membrane-bound serine protease (ClpP class)